MQPMANLELLEPLEAYAAIGILGMRRIFILHLLACCQLLLR